MFTNQSVFVKMHDHVDNGRVFHTRTIQKGVFPFTKPNPYTRVHLIEKDAIVKFSTDHDVVGRVTKNLQVSNTFERCRTETGTNGYLRLQMMNGVHNKALSKLDSELQVASNFFESWYERREVYKMVGSIGKELLEFATNYRKPKYWKRKGKASKAPSNLPAAWLTYQFGIVPLIGTLDTALKGLGLPLQAHAFKSTSADKFSGTIPFGTWGFPLDYEGTYRKTIGCTVIPNPNPNVALLNLGGFTTPFSTAWSIAPWGWAIDYFVNVSELLSNLEMKHPGVTSYDYYSTEKWDITWDGVTKDWDRDAVPERLRVLYRWNGEGHLVTRSLIGTPSYKLKLGFPTLGTNQFANLFAALALTMKGKKS